MEGFQKATRIQMVLKSVVCEEYTEGAVDQATGNNDQNQPGMTATWFDHQWLSDMIDLKTYPNLRHVMWKKRCIEELKKKKNSATAACWVSARLKGGKHGTSSAGAIPGQLSTVPWLSCPRHRPSTAAQVYGDNRCCCQTWSQSHKGLLQFHSPPEISPGSPSQGRGAISESQGEGPGLHKSGKRNRFYGPDFSKKTVFSYPQFELAGDASAPGAQWHSFIRSFMCSFIQQTEKRVQGTPLWWSVWIQGKSFTLICKSSTVHWTYPLAHWASRVRQGVRQHPQHTVGPQPMLPELFSLSIDTCITCFGPFSSFFLSFLKKSFEFVTILLLLYALVLELQRR